MKTNAAAIVALVVASAPLLAAEKVVRKSDVPKAVLTAASSKYPGAEMSRFEQDTEGGKTEYEIKLKTSSGLVEATFSDAGAFVSEERRVEMKDVPDAVQKGFAASAWGSAKVVRIEKVIEASAPAEPTWEFAVDATGKKREVVFSNAGVLTHEEAGD